MKIALVGNPNTGKTSLFNALTGLNQKVGNYPGVTVDQKSGSYTHIEKIVNVVDLPGIYSLNTSSLDEEISAQFIDNFTASNTDLLIYVLDASNLKRSLYLCAQIMKEDIPMIVALTMNDVADQAGITFDLKALQQELNNGLVLINPKLREGTLELKNEISSFQDNSVTKNQLLGESPEITYLNISNLLNRISYSISSPKTTLSNQLDAILMHGFFGYGIFLFLLALIFQSVFSWSAYPMDMIDAFFGWSAAQLTELMPSGVLQDLLVNGILAGIGGVAIFIPQIAILFFFIALMEDSGYLARISFIMDKLMRKIGLSGKSIIPLISGVACAVPAIMSARTISNQKERLITILVTPLTSCSARLPVYTLLIALVIPSTSILGIFNLQGIVLMAFYLFGFAAVVVASLVFKYILKAKEPSHLIMEMPTYKLPNLLNTATIIFEKVKVFLIDAGKIIIAISILLWALSSYGPSGTLDKIETKYASETYQHLLEPERDIQIANEKLEASYIGILGKTIEPAIRPLGFNWQIGIALITSFAAREVFMGTMSTIYSVGSDEQIPLRTKLTKLKNPKTGKPFFSLALGLSLMVFYALAMQCMSTLAIVKRETNSWKWPLIQMVYMTAMAYFGSLLAFNLF